LLFFPLFSVFLLDGEGEGLGLGVIGEGERFGLIVLLGLVDGLNGLLLDIMLLLGLNEDEGLWVLLGLLLGLDFVVLPKLVLMLGLVDEEMKLLGLVETLLLVLMLGLVDVLLDIFMFGLCIRLICGVDFIEMLLGDAIGYLFINGLASSFGLVL
jgi:hypothetical protein